jgi:excisionase family DNA binding protein
LSTNSSKNTINTSEWISQAEAARLRKVSRQAISKLVRNGRLRFVEIGGYVLVNRFDIENFKPLEPGRPKVKTNDQDK